jgi:oligoribonuclease (3'-5' exoribonuclease)
MSTAHWIILDLETTSLDPREPNACILEIGLVAVDRRLNEVAHWSSPVKPLRGDWRQSLDARATEMHQNSGLIAELLGERAMLKFEAGGLPTLEQAEAVALQFVAAYGAPVSQYGHPQAIMCGANIGSFDRQWLKVHMPKLDQAFHYRSADSNFCFLSEQFLSGAPTEKGETRHRALDDCRQSLATMRKFFGLAVSGQVAA